MTVGLTNVLFLSPIEVAEAVALKNFNEFCFYPTIRPKIFNKAAMASMFL